jgi:hypothetical protein
LNLLRHEWNMDGLSVELGGHLGGLAHVPAVHQPEPGRDGRRKVDAIVDEGQGSRTGDVLPLGSGCTTWSTRKKLDDLEPYVILGFKLASK